MITFHTYLSETIFQIRKNNFKQLNIPTQFSYLMFAVKSRCKVLFNLEKKIYFTNSTRITNELKEISR